MYGVLKSFGVRHRGCCTDEVQNDLGAPGSEKEANQVVLAHARPREQSGAFEKFKTTATASLNPGKAV